MSIASAIVNAQQKVANAYTAVDNKGGTLPATQNLSNLPNAISSIPTGSTPTGTISITQNGTYDVTNYASADVNVSGGGTKYGMSLDSILGDVNANGVLQVPSVDANLVFTGVTDIAQNGLYYKFYYNEKIKSCSFPSLTTVSSASAISYAFRQCSNLTSVDLSSLTTVSGDSAMQYIFYQCTNVTGALDLSSLTNVSSQYAMYYAFSGCSNLTSVDLSSLTTVSGKSAISYAFSGCSNLTSVDLSSLTTVSGDNAMQGVFYNCTGLTSVDLSSLTTVSGSNAMQYTFNGCTGITSVNFNSLQQLGVDSSSANYGQFTNCFNGCTSLTSITFPKLEKIYCTGGTTGSYGTFANNNKVQKLYFPKLDTITYGTGASTTNQNACKNVFYGCSELTELHFGAANQTAIEASPGYSTAWGRGAGNVTIYFDL